MGSNHPSTDAWQATIGRKLGVSLTFTQARVGQTLHVPCAHGHTVDVEVKKMQPPEAVCRNMLRAGWTIGNKLVCPDCKRKPKKVEACGTQAPPEQEDVAVVEQVGNTRLCADGRVRGTGGAPGSSTIPQKIIEALSQFEVLTLTEIADLVMGKPNTIQRHLVAMFREGALSRYLGEADSAGHRPYHYSLPKKDAAPPLKIEEHKPMPSIAAPAQPAPLAPSDDARQARRLAHMLIEEQFDIEHGYYRNGYSDQKVADETGAGLKFVVQRREDEFGPLKEPQEVVEERARLDALERAIDDYAARSAEVVASWKAEIGQHRNRMAGLVQRNGWKS